MSMLGFAIGAATALKEIQAMREIKTPEEFAEWVRSNQVSDEERRHRELCEAVRSTSFWRFGK